MSTQLSVGSLRTTGSTNASVMASFSIYYDITTYPTYITVSGYSYLAVHKSRTSIFGTASFSNGAVSVGGVSVASGKSASVSSPASASGSPSAAVSRSFTFTRNVTRGHSATTVALAASATVKTGGTGCDGSASRSNSVNISVPARPSYTVSYNANGGTNGISAAQTKWHDETLTLQRDSAAGYKKVVSSPGQPTKVYTLKAWNTKADGTGTQYALGGSYTGNAAVTLYAVWELKYVYPTINNIKIYRTLTNAASDEDEDDMGEYLFISFDWTKCSETGSSLTITPNCRITVDSNVVYTPTLTENFKYKTAESYSRDTTHSVKIELYDPNYATSQVTVVKTVGTSILPIDLYGNGPNVYMGLMTSYVEGQKLTVPEDFYINNKRIGEYFDTKLLWSGAAYMAGNQTVTLSDAVTNQTHGIILVWSGYGNGGAYDYDWVYTFIPKWHIGIAPGTGVHCPLSSGEFKRIGGKYVYVNDRTIIGNDTNYLAAYTVGSGNNSLTVSNIYWVLRAVLGV